MSCPSASSLLSTQPLAGSLNEANEGLCVSDRDQIPSLSSGVVEDPADVVEHLTHLDTPIDEFGVA